MAVHTAYIGTYGDAGVYRLTVDAGTGSLDEPARALPARGAKTLALWPGRLAASDGTGVLLAERGSGALRALGGTYRESGGACYAAYREGLLYTADFHRGEVLVYREREERPELVRRVTIGRGAGCHQVLFHKNLILVPCMKWDTVRLFDASRDFADAGSIHFPPGTGPRHGVFDASHGRFFLLAELERRVFSFRVEGTALYPAGEVQLRAGPGAASAAIRLSRDERFLYASTRGADLVEVLAVDGLQMRSVQCVSCGGKHPRDIALTPDGRFLLAANRDTSEVVSFPVDRETGRLGPEISRAAIPEAVWISFEQEEAK